jgi:hypothetical protein
LGIIVLAFAPQMSAVIESSEVEESDMRPLDVRRLSLEYARVAMAPTSSADSDPVDDVQASAFPPRHDLSLARV